MVQSQLRRCRIAKTQKFPKLNARVLNQCLIFSRMEITREKCDYLQVRKKCKNYSAIWKTTPKTGCGDIRLDALRWQSARKPTRNKNEVKSKGWDYHTRSLIIDCKPCFCAQKATNSADGEDQGSDNGPRQCQPPEPAGQTRTISRLHSFPHSVDAGQK